MNILFSSKFSAINVEQHPNREVDLDEVEEGEMVEDKLIIPEEFKNYLNQVADNELGTGNTNTVNNTINVNSNDNVPNVNESEEKQLNQSQLPQLRQVNENTSSFNQWRTPQAYQMSSPPLNPTPNTPHATDMWPCTQYQQAPPPYPNYYNQNGPSASNATTHMNCSYNNYNGSVNYSAVNYGMYFI